jgi:phosphatidylglycerophosphatase A
VSRLSFWHPAALIATVCGVGYARYAPGTAGSLVALPIAWFVGGPALPLLALALILIGWGAADVVARRGSVQDPQYVVIDEVAGQTLALIPASHDVFAFAIAFLAFRATDILKPWPASWADQKLTGGLGVMADDVVAGIYAGMIVYLFMMVR